MHKNIDKQQIGFDNTPISMKTFGFLLQKKQKGSIMPKNQRKH